MQAKSFWKQWSKLLWVKDGDSNIKYFHAIASARRKTNLIQTLTHEDNVVVHDQQGLMGVAKTYFDTLFTASDNMIDLIMNSLSQRITPADNEHLLRPFCISEFRAALFLMHADKALRPDDLNPGFYKNFWELLGPELYHAGKQWLEQGFFPEPLNQTNIVLIPKTDAPSSMKDLRPISPCNVIYKIVVMVNGEGVGAISPERGLRQGDPPSPYLFILCIELHGAKICRGAPQVSHLLFADDYFLFYKATEHECTTLRTILQ
uniref:Transposon TX1 uncharacterized n=1 Tax=Cajanus cajan TaxID=3821 RepID=A0A151U8J3_CAJCA|nr:Transposon TX1 uncharacterized [Cajanus cajan]